jgi:hypothetical protein
MSDIDGWRSKIDGDMPDANLRHAREFGHGHY